ncbi:MAG: HNH endonuclease [Phaeodactylibacter sp.]|nr:HNH endonuclease [Phaeodactylibacter sp.]
MSISRQVRDLVRRKANFACEFCGVTETDAGGELTIDHFQPKVKGGTDSLGNLIYCCNRCNLYKLDYFPASADGPVLWNPGQEPFSTHFIELDDGRLHPLTPTGAFTINRLRLNRQPLIAYRLRNQQRKEDNRLLAQYREMLRLQRELNNQLSALAEQQQQLLEEQQLLLRLLLG